MPRFSKTTTPLSALLLGVLCTAVLLSLVACGGDDTSSDAAPAAERARVPGEEAPVEEGEAPMVDEKPAPEIPPSEAEGQLGEGIEPAESTETDDPNAAHADPQPAKSSEPDVD